MSDNFQIPPDMKQIAIVKGKFVIAWYQWFAKLVNKLNELTADGTLFVPSSRTITTTSPLTGGGDLTGDLTLSITGLTVIVATAKLTGGGANGSMTFTDGVLTAQVAAT